MFVESILLVTLDEFWYRQARRAVATGALEDEWAAIAAALLANES